MKVRKDMRPDVYRYWLQLMAHLGQDTGKFFNGELIYPRQLEIHLPGDHKKPCNLGCDHCAGRYFRKDLGHWEMDALEILHHLKGAVPYHVYGGAYTEPLLNPYYLTFLATTKRYGNHFGMHTNGTILNQLEKDLGFLDELNRIATDEIDYLSVSLDAGLPESWAKTKNGKPEQYLEIIEGLRKAVNIRKKRGQGHAIRVCYLISKYNNGLKDIEAIVKTVKELGVDSLRFSIPFANYNQDFDKVREYKRDMELPLDDMLEKRLAPYLSKSKKEKPYIFYTGPEFTDIDKFDFSKCIYCYYQITFGADGYYYKCSTTATPTMAVNRLGKIDNDFDNFNRVVMKNMDEMFNASTCFSRGARCNRMGLEINREYKRILEERKSEEMNEQEKLINCRGLNSHCLDDWGEDVARLPGQPGEADAEAGKN